MHRAEIDPVAVATKISAALKAGLEQQPHVVACSPELVAVMTAFLDNAGLMIAAALERDQLARDLAAARAEVEGLRRKIDGLETQLRVTVPVPPLDASREAIVEAVEEWINRGGGSATVDEIAMAVLQAAVQAGWIVPAAGAEP